MKTASSAQRWIVFHADDFGMNAAVNAGILRAFREGLLTSTSLLANAPAVADACSAWPTLANEVQDGTIPSAKMRQSVGDCSRALDLGVHLNLTQGRPLSAGYPAELLGQHGQFPGIGLVFRRLWKTPTRFRQSVLAELRAQIERILQLGIQPTHLNGHQYVEMIPEVASLIPELAAQYSIPIVRLAKESNLAGTILRQGRIFPFIIAHIKKHYAGRFQKQIASTELQVPSRFFGTSHAGLVDTATLTKFLSYASPHGCTEIGLHPGEPEIESVSSTDDWYDPLAATRPDELKWLCHDSTCELISRYGLRLGRLTDLLSE